MNWTESFICRWIQTRLQRETSYDCGWFWEWKFWGFLCLKNIWGVIQFTQCTRFPFEECFFCEWISQIALGPILKFKFPLFWTSKYIIQSILSIHSWPFHTLQYWWTYLHSNLSHQFRRDVSKTRSQSRYSLCRGLFHGRFWSFLLGTQLKDWLKTSKASSSWTFCNCSLSLPTISNWSKIVWSEIFVGLRSFSCWNKCLWTLIRNPSNRSNLKSFLVPLTLSKFFCSHVLPMILSLNLELFSSLIWLIFPQLAAKWQVSTHSTLFSYGKTFDWTLFHLLAREFIP